MNGMVGMGECGLHAASYVAGGITRVLDPTTSYKYGGGGPTRGEIREDGGTDGTEGGTDAREEVGA